MGCLSSKPAVNDGEYYGKTGKTAYDANGYGPQSAPQRGYQPTPPNYYEYGASQQQQQQNDTGYSQHQKPAGYPSQEPQYAGLPQHAGHGYPGQQSAVAGYPAPGYAPQPYVQPPPGYPGAQMYQQGYNQYPPPGQGRPQNTRPGRGGGLGVAAGAVGGLAAAMMIGSMF